MLSVSLLLPYHDRQYCEPDDTGTTRQPAVEAIADKTPPADYEATRVPGDLCRAGELHDVASIERGVAARAFLAGPDTGLPAIGDDLCFDVVRADHAVHSPLLGSQRDGVVLLRFHFLLLALDWTHEFPKGWAGFVKACVPGLRDRMILSSERLT